jgi:replicative DNA helicase
MSAPTIPHDASAESSLIGCMLNDFRLMAQHAAALEPADFFLEKNQAIWQALQSLQKGGCARLEKDYSIYPRFVADEVRKAGRLQSVFGGDDSYIFSVGECAPGGANADAFAERVLCASALRKLVSAARKAIAEAGGPDAIDNCHSVISAAMDGVAAIATRSARCGDEHIADIAMEVLEGIRDMQAKGLPMGCPTGFPSLDSLTGGLRPGELVIVGARTGMGKTSLAIDIALNVSNAMPVKFFCLEMAKKQIAPKALSFFSHVNLKRTVNADLSEPELASQFAVVRELRKLKLYMEFEAGLSIEEICAESHAFAARHGQCLIAIDHLHYLRTGGGRHSENRNNELGRITHALKELAKKLDIPVLLLSQLNRDIDRMGGKDKMPRLSDLRDSGNIEQDADMVWFLHRQGYYDNTDPSETRLKVAKNRSGATGEVNLHFDTSTTRFSEMPS